MKIVVDVVNSEKVKQLTAEIEKQERVITKWNAKMASSTAAGQDVLWKRMEEAGQKIAIANEKLSQIPQTAAAAGRGLGQLAYAVDDIQYGFSAIVNNIPGIVMGMGGSAGIAGAAGIAAVAVNQLVKHWGDLSDIAQGMWAGNSIEQLTQLREKAEEATKAFEKLAETPSKAKAAAAQGVSGLITEGPTEKILKGAAEAIGNDPLLKTHPKEIAGGKAQVTPNEDVAKWLEMLGIDDFFPEVTQDPNERKRQLQKAIKDAQAKDVQTAKELLGAASQGDPKAMLTLEALVNRHPGNFPPEFMQDIRNETPEGQKRIEQNRLEAQGERNARKIDQDFAEKQKKLDEAEKKAWLEDIKRNRIESLRRRAARRFSTIKAR